jgi:starvation-inducible DNA-binding protein
VSGRVDHGVLVGVVLGSGANKRGDEGCLAGEAVTRDHDRTVLVAGSPLSPLAPTSIEDHTVVWELTHRIAQASELARERMDRVGAADAASQDVLIDVVRKLEQQQWMLRAQLVTRA